MQSDKPVPTTVVVLTPGEGGKFDYRREVIEIDAKFEQRQVFAMTTETATALVERERLASAVPAQERTKQVQERAKRDATLAKHDTIRFSMIVAVSVLCIVLAFIKVDIGWIAVGIIASLCGYKAWEKWVDRSKAHDTTDPPADT